MSGNPAELIPVSGSQANAFEWSNSSPATEPRNAFRVASGWGRVTIAGWVVIG